MRYKTIRMTEYERYKKQSEYRNKEAEVILAEIEKEHNLYGQQNKVQKVLL